jgi:hypothetical protein
MKKLLLLLPLCWMFSAIQTHAQQVRNVRIDADDEKVTVLYDLVATGMARNFTVCLRTSNPSIRPTSTTGAVGKNRSTGINQKIEWYYLSDGYNAEQINNLKLEIIAFDPNNPNGGSSLPARQPKKVPIYAGLGTVAVSGLGLMVAGFVKRGDAQDNYTIYKDNVNENAPIYSELGVTREEFYAETNKSHKRSQLLMYGGGAIFAAAGYILVNRVIWIKRIENQKKSKAVPTDLQCQYRPSLEMNTFSTASNGTGIGFRLNF